MDRSRYTSSAADELRRIELDARRSSSLDDLRHHFERIQALRRSYPDDFDLQIKFSEVQEIVIDRARSLRGGSTPDYIRDQSEQTSASRRDDDVAEIPPEVARLDAKSWQRIGYLSIFFAVILFAAFFYLIQTARRLNMTPAETARQSSTENKANPGASNTSAQNVAAKPVPANPTLRLYTDLVPGSATVDDRTPVDLKDGELVLDNVEPGHHSMKVTGSAGNAEFSYDVAPKAAPRVVGLPNASNVMAVLVSSDNGKARLVSNVDHLDVALDGKPIGQAAADGLSLEGLGTSDHDLQVSEGNDHQRFVLTYTPAPALTIYVKSDPNTGTVVVVTGQDGAEVYVDNMRYRRLTEHGQIRMPNFKVGKYTVRVHKDGFLDPPPALVQVKKAEETRAEFRLQPVPQVATLQIKGALPGTMVYLDGNLAADIESTGDANISNVKPGDHSIELRRDGAPTKAFQHTFQVGDLLLLSGPTVVLNKAVVENTKQTPGAVSSTPTDDGATAHTSATQASGSPNRQGEEIRKGGGFVPYSTPSVAGHYTFAALNRKGGFLRRGKLQWYAGFQNGENYVLFVLDGKRAVVRNVTNDKGKDVNRVSFNFDSDEWVQVDLSVRADAISARVRKPTGPWVEIGKVASSERDFTKNRVGFYIPGNDEIAISNFHFSPR